MAAPPTVLDVGMFVPCLWRDNQYHKCEVIEKRLDPETGLFEYYIHYVEFNKRLDEWVPADRLDMTNIETKNDAKEFLGDFGPQGAQPRRTITRNMKRKYDAINHVELHSQDLGNTALAALEKEHEEITKVKNIQAVEFGKYEVDTWYYSPYPEEFASREKLYLCEFCLKYMKKKKTLDRHKNKCTLRHPPGDEVYRDGQISVFEVDGGANKIYCQNICLLAKLFLDHKTLYYDVEPFMFYVLTENDEHGCHVVGYYSKEKESAEGYNLACILVLPPYQKKGYGRFLIALSYEISKREGVVGSPEKPLSDLGALSFRSYWTQVILEILRSYKGNLSVRDIASVTAIKPEDIVSTLTALSLIKYIKGQHVISVTSKSIEEHLVTIRPPKLNINPDLLHWEPKPKS